MNKKQSINTNRWIIVLEDEWEPYDKALTIKDFKYKVWPFSCKLISVKKIKDNKKTKDKKQRTKVKNWRII